MLKRILIIVGIVLATVILAGGIAIARYRANNLGYFERSMKKVYRAGYQDKKAEINGGTIAYLEGPDSGPTLLVIHGQMTDKYNYAPNLPELARHFHVFAVDCYGHGQSSHDPEKYSNVVQGKDLLDFIKTVIGKPTLVSGHSSGGIIAAWLAGNGESQVTGVLFEDPPFFTLSRPRTESTWNWVNLASTAHAFLSSGETDWTLYCIEHDKIWEFFGDSARQFLDQAKACRSEKPDQPVTWEWLPPIMNESYRAIPNYDPRFGDVFYRGEWEAGFDLEQTLKAIDIPCFYEKSEASVNEDGILVGATGEAEAAKARGLLRDAAFGTDKKSHGWHWQEPAEFTRRLRELQARADARLPKKDS